MAFSGGQRVSFHGEKTPIWFSRWQCANDIDWRHGVISNSTNRNLVAFELTKLKVFKFNQSTIQLSHMFEDCNFDASKLQLPLWVDKLHMLRFQSRSVSPGCRLDGCRVSQHTSIRTKGCRSIQTLHVTRNGWTHFTFSVYYYYYWYHQLHKYTQYIAGHKISKIEKSKALLLRATSPNHSLADGGWNSPRGNLDTCGKQRVCSRIFSSSRKGWRSAPRTSRKQSWISLHQTIWLQTTEGKWDSGFTNQNLQAAKLP